MAGMLIAAAVALGVAGWLVFTSRTEKTKYQKALLMETSSTATLRELHKAATETAGENSYREAVELDGTAQPGPGGLLTSELTGTECVWYMQKVTRRYKDVYRDSDGHRRTRNKEEVLTRNRSKDPFVLRDADGEVTVVPETNVQSAKKVLSEFREGRDHDNGPSFSFGGLNVNLGSSGDGDTIGFKYEEWVLPVGTHIYVQGSAVDRSGELQVCKGEEAMVISTRSEEEILEEHRKKSHAAKIGSVVAAVAAVGLAVGAFFVG
ncbi:hypothetical protein ASG90_04380 [Nocardioides sp. Soil797]|nr:hypothetical protein ASG90_04380 [Nocardioides sp. Soil797]